MRNRSDFLSGLTKTALTNSFPRHVKLEPIKSGLETGLETETSFVDYHTAMKCKSMVEPVFS